MAGTSPAMTIEVFATDVRHQPHSLRRGRAGVSFSPSQMRGVERRAAHRIVCASNIRVANANIQNAWHRLRDAAPSGAPHVAVILRYGSLPGIAARAETRTAGERVCETLPPDRTSSGFLQNHRKTRANLHPRPPARATPERLMKRPLAQGTPIMILK